MDENPKGPVPLIAAFHDLRLHRKIERLGSEQQKRFDRLRDQLEPARLGEREAITLRVVRRGRLIDDQLRTIPLELESVGPWIVQARTPFRIGAGECLTLAIEGLDARWYWFAVRVVDYDDRTFRVRLRILFHLGRPNARTAIGDAALRVVGPEEELDDPAERR